MKTLKLVFVILLMSFTTPNDPLIIWSQNTKLKVSDFIQTDIPLPGNATATACTGIYLQTDRSRLGGWKAYAVFDKNNSKWYKYNQTNCKDQILQHEQLHFDITNYMAVQLDNKLKTFQTVLDQNTIDNLFKQYQLRLDSMQKWYDNSSDHSRDSLSQSKWNRYVDSLLRDL